MKRVEHRSDVAGSVWKIEVQLGDAVAEGDTLIVLESMKMEIPVVAETAGKVAEILVEESDAVEEGEVLLLLEG